MTSITAPIPIPWHSGTGIAGRRKYWMALHGINLPLAVVGAEWCGMMSLTQLGYPKDEINEFIAGPAFQGWWLMNNLEGWGRSQSRQLVQTA